jgi:hypothetical protein
MAPLGANFREIVSKKEKNRELFSVSRSLAGRGGPGAPLVLIPITASAPKSRPATTPKPCPDTNGYDWCTSCGVGMISDEEPQNLLYFPPGARNRSTEHRNSDDVVVSVGNRTCGEGGLYDHRKQLLMHDRVRDATVDATDWFVCCNSKSKTSSGRKTPSDSARMEEGTVRTTPRLRG